MRTQNPEPESESIYRAGAKFPIPAAHLPDVSCVLGGHRAVERTSLSRCESDCGHSAVANRRHPPLLPFGRIRADRRGVYVSTRGEQLATTGEDVLSHGKEEEARRELSRHGPNRGCADGYGSVMRQLRRPSSAVQTKMKVLETTSSRSRCSLSPGDTGQAPLRRLKCRTGFFAAVEIC